MLLKGVKFHRTPLPISGAVLCISMSKCPLHLYLRGQMAVDADNLM